MHKIYICYENQSNAIFDKHYFLSKHIPVIKKAFMGAGLQKLDISLGDMDISTENSKYIAIVDLYFGDRGNLLHALKVVSRAILSDINSYSNIKPTIYWTIGCNLEMLAGVADPSFNEPARVAN